MDSKINNKKNKIILYSLIILAMIILVAVGSTFAYFSATVTSENTIDVGAAEFKLSLKDDTSLIKDNMIPSIVEYVDITTQKRLDENGDFILPTTNPLTGEKIIEGTTCVDDNKMNICSIYTFTILNPMTNLALPLYITMEVTENTFENLYYKVLDENKKEVIPATHIIDDRYEVDTSGKYLKDEEGNWIPKANFSELSISPIVFNNINTTLEKAKDEDNPSSVTYSVVLWIQEMHRDQNIEDGGKTFKGTLVANASGADGHGITGTMNITGNE